ncbi:hypothetical protein BK125_28315 [Paenibacillus odorifer]|jgi:hypothetical protein|uniref:Phage ABA sandwich domain-containing protein n=1 Tax=Paenibacillus odorifer TaxID=189426 RepID=A0ABX3GCK9_9BACL|nr:hypothetical protein BK125_28315 [Paenibacillus odorifer]OMC99014.1 hypothetical protein BSO21_33030 [Paenibacillus odorifer]
MKLGLSYEDLEQMGFVEYQGSTLDVFDEMDNDIELSKFDTKTKWNESSHEAIIRAVAKMIEGNNAALLKQLKAAGVSLDL